MKILIGIIIALSAMPTALAMEQSFLFQSIGYGRGWIPYVCLAEHGTAALPAQLNGLPTCDLNGAKLTLGSTVALPAQYQCPFEESALNGFACNSKAGAGYPTGIVASINIPEDMKLVTQDGFVITTETCPDQQITPQVGAKNGEWWFRGGVDDSPPIHWVDDVVAFVQDVMDYHKNTDTNRNAVFTAETFQKGYIDPLFKVPIYFLPRSGYQTNSADDEANSLKIGGQAGNLVCSLKRKGSTVPGSTVKPGEEVDMEFEVLCTFYYFAKSNSGFGAKNSGQTIILRHPTIIQASPATTNDWNKHNVKYSTVEDFFRLGSIQLKRKIAVVAPTKAELEITPEPTAVQDAQGNSVFNIVIRNLGTGTAGIEKLELGEGNKLLYCDAESIAPGRSVECLAAIANPAAPFQLAYAQTSCGKSSSDTVSFSLTADGLDAAPVVEAGEPSACTLDAECGATGLCCAGSCRDPAAGVCEDTDNDGQTDAWIAY
ncbi:MAG: hypothetical protein HY519_01770 [Candidatus Aenigmarchaeota archaeon]|nr:hypothetical protein [Candidatus Aenigmarchaeota archaeon]